jgi:hypothetical protein
MFVDTLTKHNFLHVFTSIDELLSDNSLTTKEVPVIEPLKLPETMSGVYDYVAKNYTDKNKIRLLPELGYRVRRFKI